MYHIPRYFSREYTNRDLDKSPNHLVLRIMLKSCSVKIGLCFSEIAHQFFTNPNIIFCHFTVIFGFLKTPWKVSKDVCFIKNNVVFMLIIINKWEYRNLEKHLTAVLQNHATYEGLRVIFTYFNHSLTSNN